MVTTNTVGEGNYTYTVDKQWGRGAASGQPRPAVHRTASYGEDGPSGDGQLDCRQQRPGRRAGGPHAHS